MFGRSRQPQTHEDSLRPLVEDLMLRLANLEAKVNSMRTEWEDVRDQVRRSYQRLEKAAQRAEKAKAEQDGDQRAFNLPGTAEGHPSRGYMAVMDRIRRQQNRNKD